MANTFEKRKEWLLEYIRLHKWVDILDTDFVDLYVSFSGAKHKTSNWGANSCSLLSHDLKKLYEVGLLDRAVVRLGANWQPGFPKWVYSYGLKELYSQESNGVYQLKTPEKDLAYICASKKRANHVERR